MYTRDEYRNRIKELAPVARELAERKTPDKARGIVSKMSPEDAYIIGRWLGKMLALDDFASTVAGIVIKIENREAPGDFNLN